MTAGLGIAAFISFLVSNSPDLLRAVGEFFSGLVNALVAAFGYVTLTFAILERVLPPSEFEDKEKWSPAELTKEPAPEQIKSGDLIAGIVVTAILLGLLNFYPKIVGIWMLADDEWMQFARLSEAFFRYLPWVNLSGLLTIALDFWLLRQGNWTPLTHWLHIGLQAISIAIAAFMLSGPSLVTFAPGVFEAETGKLLTALFSRLVPAILITVIVASLFEIGKDMLRMRRASGGNLPF
jgi:hypothetical protein